MSLKTDQCGERMGGEEGAEISVRMLKTKNKNCDQKNVLKKRNVTWPG